MKLILQYTDAIPPKRARGSSDAAGEIRPGGDTRRVAAERIRGRAVRPDCERSISVFGLILRRYQHSDAVNGARSLPDSGVCTTGEREACTRDGESRKPEAPPASAQAWGTASVPSIPRDVLSSPPISHPVPRALRTTQS